MVSTLTSMGLSDTSQPRGSKINPLEISKTVVIKAPFFAMGWLISSLKKYFLISSYLWFQQNGRGGGQNFRRKLFHKFSKITSSVNVFLENSGS